MQITPLLQQIHADVPGACVEMFINASAAPVLEGCPWIGRLHVLEEAEMKNGGLLQWRMWRHVWRAGKFDALLHLDLQWSRGALMRFMGAGRSAAFVTKGRKPWKAAATLMTTPVDFSENARHTSLWYLDLWRELSGTEDRGFEYDVRFLLKGEVIKRDSRRIALVPGASHANPLGAIKRWPVAHWVELAQLLIADGWSPVFVGTAMDFPADQIPAGAEDHLLDPEPSAVRKTAQAIASCAALIGNDTGLYQIAMGLGVPTIGLFGSTSSMRTGPFRNPNSVVLSETLPCVPCYQSACHRAEELHPGMSRPFCLSLIGPRRVFESLMAFVGKSPFKPSALVGAA